MMLEIRDVRKQFDGLKVLDGISFDVEKSGQRPLLAGGTHEDVIDQYNRCIGHYRAAADYRLDNSKGFVLGVKNLTELVESIT